MPAAEHDVIIVGAGMVGATLAIRLADSGFTVAVIERGGLMAGWDAQEYGARVSALNLGSERFLTALGVWPDLSAQRISSYERMYVWDAGSSGKIEFDCAEYGLNHLGTIVENDLLTALLHRMLKAHDNIRLITEVDLDAIDHSDTTVAVRWREGGRAGAKLLVGADGAGSWVRKALAMGIDAASYGQSGIVARVGTERSHAQTAWQRFLASGPLAFLPLANGDCSIVWSCEQNLADELLALDDAGFARRLSAAFDWKLGEVTRVWPRKAYPLSSVYAPYCIDERSVLVGDAAHVVHPLAGQGVNLGLADAAALAEVLTEADRKKKDIGQHLTLRRYERWRKKDNLGMVSAMTAMKRLFGTEFDPVSRLRGAGLNAVDRLDPLKYLFAGKALGISGDLPAIMRANVG